MTVLSNSAALQDILAEQADVLNKLAEVEQQKQDIVNALNDEKVESLITFAEQILDDKDSLTTEQIDRIKLVAQKLAAISFKILPFKLPGLLSDTGKRERRNLQKQMVLEQALSCERTPKSFNHVYLSKLFGEQMNNGKPVQRTFYRKQLQSMIDAGKVSVRIEGSGKTGEQIFQFEL